MKNLKEFSIGSLVAAGLSLVTGMYKLLIYENGEAYDSTPMNAHVGGDAYNFIINGTHATAYFILFGAFLIAAILIQILEVVRVKSEEQK